MKVILDAGQIGQAIDALAQSIHDELQADIETAVIGIRSRGEIVAQRLAKRLSELRNEDVPCGALDITLYRDDLHTPHSNAAIQVRTTEIVFNVDDKVIILVDDVLHTGRSTRAALDALIDLGRPQAIRLAVLVERSGREFPIQADYVGCRAQAKQDELVLVNLVESDGVDRVTIE